MYLPFSKSMYLEVSVTIWLSIWMYLAWPQFICSGRWHALEYMLTQLLCKLHCSLKWLPQAHTVRCNPTLFAQFLCYPKPTIAVLLRCQCCCPPSRRPGGSPWARRSRISARRRLLYERRPDRTIQKEIVRSGSLDTHEHCVGNVAAARGFYLPHRSIGLGTAS